MSDALFESLDMNALYYVLYQNSKLMEAKQR